MNLYEKNLEFFKDNSTPIYDIIMSGQSQYASIVTAADSLTIKAENEGRSCFIHSLYDVERETGEMFAVSNKNAGRLIIFGMGIGYSRDYIKSNFAKLKNIVIVEPDLNLFKTLLNYLDIKDLLEQFASVSVTFVINQSKEDAVNILLPVLSENLMVKTDFVYNVSYRSLYADYYEFINRQFADYARNFLINTVTYDSTLYQSAENSIKNFKLKAAPLTQYRDKFADIPCIIVSAGPSLNYTLPYLKEVKDKAVIIAVGTAIKILDSNGFVPHFRMAYDSGDAERNIFIGIDTQAAPLIFSDLLSPLILNDYKGKKVRMILDISYISRYLFKDLYPGEIIFASGFSVANVALNVAVNLGFKKVIFVGQDLCYTEGSLYAKGGWMEQDGNFDFQSGGYIKTTNSIGEMVYTDKLFLGMKNLFEQTIMGNPGISYINATERGLDINGTQNKNFVNVMKEDLTAKRDIESIINEAIPQTNHNGKNPQEILKQLGLSEQIKALEEINERRLKSLKKLKKHYDGGLGVNRLQSDFDYIKSIDTELEDVDFYREGINPVISNKFNAIRMSYYYDGNDERLRIKSEIKASIGITVELKRYLEFLTGLLEEQEALSTF